MPEIKERKKKNGKISYTAVIRIKGYPQMSATFERLTDAKNWAAPIESEMKRGKHIKDFEAKKHTLAELIDRYIENELKDKKTTKSAVRLRYKKTTHNDNKRAQLTWWKDKIGHCLLSDITPALISKYKDVLSHEPSSRFAKTKEPRSDSTVNRYLSSLSVVLTKASKEWGWMESNPMVNVAKKSESRGRTRFLSEGEYKKLLDKCRLKSKELYMLVLIALSTGARAGEIITLRVQDIDLKNKMFHFIDTKNGEDRGVPITGILFDELKAFLKVRNISSDYIFIKPDNKTFVNFRSSFETAVKNADIKDFRFHDLRHTAASYLAMNGASLLEIAEILGHKTLAMVKRYSHLTKKHTAGVLENMNNAMFGEA